MKKSFAIKTKSIDGLNAVSKTATGVKSVDDHRRHHRSDPSMATTTGAAIAPTLHPWYYVKGRPDLTEKRISSRRERDDKKYRLSEDNSQYFARRLAENQVHRRWSDNKTLVKHGNQVASDVRRPPFDVIIDGKDSAGDDKRLQRIGANKELQKKYRKSKERLKEFLESFREMDVHCDERQKRQNILVFQLSELKKIKTRFDEREEFFDLKDRQLGSQRFNRVKLRRKCFEILDHLNHHKNSVKYIQSLTDFKTVLTDEEAIQLSDVMERAVKIIDMYIDVNNDRNDEFQLFYDEEADNRWEQQESEWITEYEVWDVMTQKLMDSYGNILKDKLTQVLAEETEALAERERLLKDLTTFTAQLKKDPNLSILLTENVYDFETAEVADNQTKS